ncbi:ribosomal protein L20 [Rubrobacter radiotolerans]|uniref:Large ribosomal subunit protein bL20 n=1 Tax=Rubrobacter radiotolerans TaxID=42256 RepID=A0A023X2A5_RUBRA|nr:ribosomal protein L20 [Rubrobacter radiotolerans]SMC04872.1 large subunit ribosomal protein L20 [Rubrobacter radiotolerans DSM 5868]
MARTARSVHARKKRRKVLEQAKGYRGTKKSSYKRAKEQVWKSGVYAYVGRKQKKRDFRALWIQRINAAARESGLSYSQFIHGVKLAGLDLDRKVLAELAATEPTLFSAVAAQAKNALEGKPVDTSISLDWSPTEPEPRTAAKKGSVSRSKKNSQRRAALAAQDESVPYEASASTGAASGATAGSATETTAPAEPEQAEPAEASTGTTETAGTAEAAGVTPSDISATDAAEERAGELGVDLSTVEGTGADGNITVEDVERTADEQGKVVATEGAIEKTEELGVNLENVEGTGAHGRITVEDVEKAAKEQDGE